MSGQGLAMIAADLVLLRHAHSIGSWDWLSQSWKATLLEKGAVISKATRGPYYMCVGICAKAVLTLWPLKVVRVKQHKVVSFEDCAAKDLLFVPLVRLADWVVLPVKAHSPLRIFS
eukprot:10730698-Alexandrium_andersonii.AAC.1